MDFLQVSTPLRFIPFCLDNLPEDNEQIPESTSVETSDSSANQPPVTTEGGPQASPLSVDSETDVNVFAEAMVQIMEKVQSPLQEKSIVADPSTNEQIKDRELESDLTLPEVRNRTSTPIPGGHTCGRDISSTSLEANLQVAPTSRTKLTELHPVQANDDEERTREEKEPSGEDTSSSLHDAPPLPDGVSIVRYLIDTTERELPEENEDSSVPLLYTEVPQGVESGTERGDESSSYQVDPAILSTSTGQTHFRLHELSGRSRALLKE